MGIAKEVWSFQVGGYQPLEKYLKDRKGTVLSTEAVEHYVCMVGWIEKTIEVMEQIDLIASPVLLG